MSTALPELAPVAERVLLRPLLIPLTRLAAYLFAFGICLAVDAVVRALFGTATGLVGWVPYIGKVISSPLLAIEHKITSYIGGFESYLEQSMASYWHNLASLGTWVAQHLEYDAAFYWQLARHVSTLYGNAATGGLFKAHAQAAKVADAQAEAAAQVAVRAAKQAQAAAASAAGATVIPYPRVISPPRTYPVGRIGSKVAGLEGEVEGLIDWTIPGIRERVGSLEGELGRLWDRIRGKTAALGVTAAVGVVAAVLGKLGMGWLRCDSVQKTAQRLCGMNPSLLDNLLLGTLVLGGGFSIVQLAKDLLAVETEIVDGVKLGIRELRPF